MRLALLGLMSAVVLAVGPAVAGDELVTSAQYADGEVIPYVLTSYGGTPTHAILMMPGGPGNLSPHLDGDGQLVMRWANNFLMRVRSLFAGPRIVAVSMDATTTPERVMAVVDSLERRFGPLKVYVAGNSMSSASTMRLGERLDGKLAGFIHTSSVNAIASYDTRQFHSRHLMVAHRMDSCSGTVASSAQHAHNVYGTDLILMEGGVSVGKSCEAVAHHGFNGIEQQTVDRIVAWMLDDR
jgi:pimeloyl-ACP methyl ester carboxylesterase